MFKHGSWMSQGWSLSLKGLLLPKFVVVNGHLTRLQVIDLRQIVKGMSVGGFDGLVPMKWWMLRSIIMALFQWKPFEDFDWNGKSTNETKLLEGPRLDCGRLRPICTSNRNQEKIFIPPVPSGATTYSDVLSLAAGFGQGEERWWWSKIPPLG